MSKVSLLRLTSQCYKRTSTGRNRQGAKRRQKYGAVCNNPIGRYIKRDDITCYPRKSGGGVCNAKTAGIFKKFMKKKLKSELVKRVKKGPRKKPRKRPVKRRPKKKK